MDYSTMISIEAVVKTYQAEPFTLWPTANLPPMTFVAVNGKTTPDEVGSIIYCLGSKIREVESAADVIENIITEETIILPGGIRVRDGEKTINPGCCCGLEAWREFLDVGENDFSIWWGHDPSPWIKTVKKGLRLRSGQKTDMHLEKPKIVSIDVSIEDFQMGMIQVQKDLSDFLTPLRQWAETYVPEMAERLVARFDDAFEITSPTDRTLSRKRRIADALSSG